MPDDVIDSATGDEVLQVVGNSKGITAQAIADLVPTGAPAAFVDLSGESSEVEALGQILIDLGLMDGPPE